MSGPKCGHYTVVSEEELRRRRLAAARDRFSRARAELLAFRVELNAAEATYGVLAFAGPADEVPDGEDASALETGAEQLERAVESARAELDRAVSAARVRHFAAEGSKLTASLKESGPRRRAAADQPGETREEVARVLARLPGSATQDAVASCNSLATKCLTAVRATDREQLLAALRLAVQRESDRARTVAANRTKIGALYAELDGLAGRDVEVVRGLLKGAALDEPVTPDLEARVLAARNAAREELDREFVLGAAAEALAQLGYSIGEDFITAVPEGGGLVDLPHSARHGVMVRERDGQLLVNVVRYDSTGNREPADDTAAEESFCTDFDAVRSILAERGVELDMLRADAPGATPMQVVPGRTRPARRSSAAPRPRERRR
jgi:hypothetical protein